MTEDDALDAALLAFTTMPEEAQLRDKIQAATTALLSALQCCPTCRGSGKVLVEHSRIYEDDGYRAAAQPVEAGTSITCVTCGGYRIDPARVIWTCRLGHGCRPEQDPDPAHAACGWTLRLKPAAS